MCVCVCVACIYRHVFVLVCVCVSGCWGGRGVTEYVITYVQCCVTLTVTVTYVCECVRMKSILDICFPLVLLC